MKRKGCETAFYLKGGGLWSSPTGGGKNAGKEAGGQVIPETKNTKKGSKTPDGWVGGGLPGVTKGKKERRFY